MIVRLHRFAYTPTETQGCLMVGDWSCFTIEQPWRRGEFPGGEPFKSCIPDGKYDLMPFQRPNGDKVFALVNPALGVHLLEGPYGSGRFLCLIHAANYAGQVQGCIAPGDSRAMLSGRMMVTNSAKTLEIFHGLVPLVEGHSIEITAATGAIDAPLRVKYEMDS